MDRKRFLHVFVGKGPLLIILANTLLLLAPFATAAWAFDEPGDSDKQRIIRQVADDWMDVARKQYERAYFKAAKRSLYQAQQYEQYLTDTKREKLKALFQDISKAVTQRERNLQLVRKADELIKNDKLIGARMHLEMVKSSIYLTQKEKQLVTIGIPTQKILEFPQM